MFEVERLGDLGAGKARGDVRVRLQVRAEISFALDGLHGVALDEHVGLLALHSFFDERQEDPFAEEKATRAIEVLLESLGINDQPVYERSRAFEHEREGGR